MDIKISPSVLASDFANLESELKKCSDGGAELIHLDVMDGHFVPNISIGAPVIAALDKVCETPFDVHLMISDPLFYIDDFIKAGADIITFHVECENKIKEDTTATSRCMPFEQEALSSNCVCCGKPAKAMVYWGKAY